MFAVIALAYAISGPVVAPQPTPLREVVYKVSSLRVQSIAIETFGGSVDNTGGGNTNSGNSSENIIHEPQPTANRNATLQEGTLTIDVLGIEQDVIRVLITENFKSRSAPFSYEAFVGPTGRVRFDTDNPSTIARYLVPLFGTKFAATETFNAGDSWHLDLKTDAVNVQNIFTISGQDGPLLLLDERETVRLTSARGMSYDVFGKLKYKPSLLVPISGDINEHGGRSTMDSSTEMTTTVHFERVSDTRDTTPPGPK
jgi:hypothetical protein